VSSTFIACGFSIGDFLAYLARARRLFRGLLEHVRDLCQLDPVRGVEVPDTRLEQRGVRGVRADEVVAGVGLATGDLAVQTLDVTDNLPHLLQCLGPAEGGLVPRFRDHLDDAGVVRDEAVVRRQQGVPRVVVDLVVPAVLDEVGEEERVQRPAVVHIEVALVGVHQVGLRPAFPGVPGDVMEDDVRPVGDRHGEVVFAGEQDRQLDLEAEPALGSSAGAWEMVRSPSGCGADAPRTRLPFCCTTWVSSWAMSSWPLRVRGL
jgi:hypothetical protein